jgi:hypothetical protein
LVLIREAPGRRECFTIDTVVKVSGADGNVNAPPTANPSDAIEMPDVLNSRQGERLSVLSFGRLLRAGGTSALLRGGDGSGRCMMV